MNSANIQEILILLTVAIVIVAVFKRLHLSPVIGYLAAGGAIGPYGFSLIPDVEHVKHIAEFGVVFLLFSIGLELTFQRLKSMRIHVFGFGSLQLILTGGIIGIITYMLVGRADIAIIIGSGLALSSTAIVLQVLQENGISSTQSGRLAIATLILQDLAVVPLLIMIPLFAENSLDVSVVIKDAIINASIVLIVIFVLGIRLLRPLYHAIANIGSQELLTATTLLVVLGASFATQQAGLSLALGAFIAGLLVAETEFRPQVEVDIMPFKGLLMGLFFISVGMSIDFHLLSKALPLIFILTIALVLGKSCIVYILARMFGFRKWCSAEAGLLLSQGSEFTFVLFGLAVLHGVMAQEISQILLIVISLSMAFTPLLYAIHKHFNFFKNVKESTNIAPIELNKETIDLEDHIIVIGFGRSGKTSCQLLSSRNINYVAIDENTRSVERGKRNGYPVYYGNAARMDILKSIGIQRAKLVLITVDSRVLACKITDLIHKDLPDTPLIVRAHDRVHAQELRNLGATTAVAELFESSLILGDATLRHIGVPESEIDRAVKNFRAKENPTAII